MEPPPFCLFHLVEQTSDATINADMIPPISPPPQSTADMLWLDSTYPAGSSAPGTVRGSCPTTSGNPSYLRSTYPNSNVIFSNIRFGPIGSTVNIGTAGTGTGGNSSPAPPPAATTTAQPPPPQQSCPALYSSYVAQCGAPPVSSCTAAAAAAAATTATTVAPAKPCSTLYGQCGGIGWSGATCCASGTCVPQSGNPYYSQCLP